MSVDESSLLEGSFLETKPKQSRVHQSRGLFDAIEQLDSLSETLLVAESVHGFFVSLVVAETVDEAVFGFGVEERLVAQMGV